MKNIYTPPPPPHEVGKKMTLSFIYQKYHSRFYIRLSRGNINAFLHCRFSLIVSIIGFGGGAQHGVMVEKLDFHWVLTAFGLVLHLSYSQ